MNQEQFMRELNGVKRDVIREGIEDDVFPYLGIDDIKRAMLALREQAHSWDLFMDTEPPTDEALLLIFAMIVLP